MSGARNASEISDAIFVSDASNASLAKVDVIFVGVFNNLNANLSSINVSLSRKVSPVTSVKLLTSRCQ